MYRLQPANEGNELFYHMESEAAERHGAIGHFRADFGNDGFGFFFKWFDCQPHLKTPAFRRELDSVVNTLRTDGQETPFASRKVLESFCSAYPGKNLAGRHCYSIRTYDFSYYFRCLPRIGDYDIYVYAYDNRYLLPELAGQHELPELCFSTLPGTGEVIIVKNGESGYFRCDYSVNDRQRNRMTADLINERMGVTKGQEEAMLAGSIFGWGNPAAKPWRYNLDGSLRHMAQKKGGAERQG